MKFSILSHAGMLVESEKKSVLLDPWLIGSTYWRSWWNYPSPPKKLIKNLKPDYIYITHLHWDHFHGPSLQNLFNNDQKFIVPKFHTKRMVEDLKYLGFENIYEIEHGEHFKISDSFSIASFQVGLIADSTCVLYDKDTTLLNMNDCKLFGLPLKKIIKDFPKIDFFFRSHSSASPIPYCFDDYSFENCKYKNIRPPSEYIEEFCLSALKVKAKYAVPFASNHCFLHKDTFKFNKLAVSPDLIPLRYKELALQKNLDSQCVVMAPGSSWDSKNGFNIENFDFSKRDLHLEKLLSEKKNTLNKQYKNEEACLADYESFQIYFKQLIKTIPWFLKIYKEIDVVFKTKDKNKSHFWYVNLSSGLIKKVDTNFSSSILIEISPSVLNDCCKIKMFSVWGPSKRLSIKLNGDGAFTKLTLFLFILDAFELSLFPLKKHFNFRSFKIWSLRWRDFIEFFKLFFQHYLLNKKFDIVDLYK